MRFKPVPEPPESLDGLADARRAVPLVPTPPSECRRRLRRRLDLPGADAARTWLTFLRALELVTRTREGLRRRRTPLSRDRLGTALAERVFGVRELLAALHDAGRPLSGDEAFDRIRHSVPSWERLRDPDWEATWRGRVWSLLEWMVLVGMTTGNAEGYLAADR
jgi:hypothetical protein